MTKAFKIFLLSAFLISFTAAEANALINIDKESIKIAIKYGLDNKYSTSKTLLGPNWVEGEEGIILNIFSPFIQLATKARSENVPGTSEEDIILVKKRVGREINQIKTKNEVRFIVQLVGEKGNFGKDYTAYIEEIKEEEPGSPKKKKGFWIFKNLNSKPKKVHPTTSILDENAELDNYNPLKPFSCTNSYNFSFDKLNKLDAFNFVLKGPKDKLIKFTIEKDVIF